MEIIRAMGGRNTSSLGRDLSRADLFKNVSKHATGWYYTGSSISDHVHRLVTFRAIAGYPLVISIGRATDEIFAAFQAKKQVYYIVASALTLLILIVMGVGIRAGLSREKMSRERDLQNRRFDAVLSNMPLGVCLFDDDRRLVLSNERYRAMYEMPPELLRPGTRFVDIISHRKTIGTIKGEPNEFCQEFINKLSTGGLLKLPVKLNDGRVISVLNQPMEGGGWISIHGDITEQQLASERLEQTKRFLDTVIESVPIPIVVKDATSQKFILVNQAYEAFFGWPREKLIGRTVFDLFSQEQAQRIADSDSETVRKNARRVDVDVLLETPANGARTITATRLVVCDIKNRPQYLISVIEDTTEKKKAHARIAFMAHHDAVTGLPNRIQLGERIEGALAEIKPGEWLALHFLDLDDFKVVNDTLGHLVGDELLKQVAERLRDCVGDRGVVARLGGDEFAILQLAVHGLDDISSLAEQVRTAVKAPYELGGLRAVVDVSIGISQAPDDGKSSVELLKRADLALYKAKGDGRGTFRFFEADIDSRLRARRRLEIELRNAIANDEFRLFYQPAVNIREDRIDCVEGLLRWFHPERGIVLPSEFIAAAEETGLIIPLGEWVIRQACRDAAAWPQHVKVAANLSPVQLSGGNLMAVVSNALETSGLAPERLELEITEETLLRHNQENLSVLSKLRSHGVHIAMDDFGIGYSSLNYLRHFAFDKIKIDRSFIADLSVENELSLAIVQSVARLARVLDVSITAEGVETTEQLELVKAAGCTHYQGYLFSGPKSADEISSLLAHPAAARATAA